MSFTPRSLIGNSFGSIIASGTVIIATVFMPALLVRSLSASGYHDYLIALALLPILLLLPQSNRTVGASQLALASKDRGREPAISEFLRFTIWVSCGQLVLCLVGIEVYLQVGSNSNAAGSTLRLALWALLAYSMGLLAVGLIASPAAAEKDFRPENLAKAWPSLFQVAGILVVWLAEPTESLWWVFAIYVASSWSIALLLLLHLGRRLQPIKRPLFSAARGLQGQFIRGLGGVLWWNVTAFLSTSVSVMIVALSYPSALATFSNASALLGIVSGGLIAVSGPIVLHAAAMAHSDVGARRRLFLWVNCGFQIYIFVAAVAIVIVPERLYELWLNAELASGVKAFSLLLLPATVLRIITMAFTMFVMSAGQQHKLWLSPLVEASISCVGCIVLGSLIGVNGIPLALAIGAAARLALTVFHDCEVNRSTLHLGPADVLFPAFRILRPL